MTALHAGKCILNVFMGHRMVYFFNKTQDGLFMFKMIFEFIERKLSFILQGLFWIIKAKRDT